MKVLDPSHNPTLLRLLPQLPPVTMLAELHARLAVKPHRFRNPADRTLPDIRRHPAAPGNIHGPGQRDRCHLLSFHRLVIARAADPPGSLQVLGPGPSFYRIFFNKPGAFLPAGIVRGLRLQDLKFFCSHGPRPDQTVSPNFASRCEWHDI